MLPSMFYDTTIFNLFPLRLILPLWYLPNLGGLEVGPLHPKKASEFPQGKVTPSPTTL